MSILNEEQLEFAMYFEKEYVSRIEQWCTFSRIGTPVNTNMFVESFHRLLKVVYLENKQNRRVDYLVYTLIKIARHLVFERLIKLEKGKRTHRKYEINKRHKAAEKMERSGVEIVAIDDNRWKVTSASDKDVCYTVACMKQECKCQLKCSECEACFHMYNCSCLDAAIHATVCKHTHLICMKHKGSEVHESSRNEFHSTTAETDIQCDHDYFRRVLDTKTSDLDKAKEEVRNKLFEVVNLVSVCNNLDTLKAVGRQTDSSIAVLKCMEGCSYSNVDLSVRKRPAPNSKNTPQIRFTSTKKKRTKSPSLTVPSRDQVAMVRSTLSQVDVTVCAVCFKEQDSGDGDLVKWTKCSTCDGWLHVACTSSSCPDRDDFVCQNCA